MDNKSIKENISRIREEKFLSQEEMAERLHITRNSYRRIEKGGTSLIRDKLFEIADILEVDVVELILGSGNNASDAPAKVGLEEATSYYESRIKEREDAMQSEKDALSARISDLEKKVQDLEKWLRDKEEIIELMKRHQAQF